MKTKNAIPEIRIIDIGASGGLDSRWKDHKVSAVLVEPDPREIENLRAKLPPYFKFIPMALSKEKGIKTFYLYKKQESSSFYPPNFEFVNKFPNFERFEVVKTIQFETDSLDNQLSLIKFSSPDLLKIDVEGHELDILQGAISTLSDLVALDLEVNFAEIRKEVPLFGEVDCYLRSKGFKLIDIRKTYWARLGSSHIPFRKGQLVLGDALYFLDPSDVFKKFKRII